MRLRLPRDGTGKGGVEHPCDAVTVEAVTEGRGMEVFEVALPLVFVVVGLLAL
jgi:hypothetical protein